MREHVTEVATKYHHQQTLLHMVEGGLSEEDAIMQADLDLIEWSKPLPLPDAPESAWWE